MTRRPPVFALSILGLTQLAAGLAPVAAPSAPGAPDVTLGTCIDMGQGAVGFATGTNVEWHMRVKTRFPWIPYTPWLTPSGNAATLTDVLMPNDLVSAEAPPPAGMEFSPAWPNPSREAVTFSFHLPVPSRVGVAIYDVQGRLVQDLSPAARLEAATGRGRPRSGGES